MKQIMAPYCFLSVVCVYSKLPLECVTPIIGSRDISRVFYADEHDT